MPHSVISDLNHGLIRKGCIVLISFRKKFIERARVISVDQSYRYSDGDVVKVRCLDLLHGKELEFVRSGNENDWVPLLENPFLHLIPIGLVRYATFQLEGYP